MQFIIHQSFCIHTIKVGSITNSSVLQIGSTGSISALSEVYNTGQFNKPAAKEVYEEYPYGLGPHPAENGNKIAQNKAVKPPIVPLAPI